VCGNHTSAPAVKIIEDVVAWHLKTTPTTMWDKAEEEEKKEEKSKYSW